MHFRASSIHYRCALGPLLFALGGCSGTDIGYPRVSDTVSCPELVPADSTAGTASVATAGMTSSSGGAPAIAGAAAGGSNPSVAGGGSATAPTDTAGAAPVGGTGATALPFAWPAAYDAAATPTPTDGHHNAGASCMSSTCHGTKVPFVFGGTVYKADGVTGAPNVEVGISDGTSTLTAYSASNGNLWLPSSASSINLAAAQIAIRNAKGEKVKPATAGRGAACNGGGCHGSTMRLIEP